MSRCVFSVEAANDIDELTEYTRSLPLGPGIALAKSLQETIRRIVLYPMLGPLDQELSRTFRRAIHRRVCRDYIFFYALEADKVEILAILHGKRNSTEICRGRAGLS